MDVWTDEFLWHTDVWTVTDSLTDGWMDVLHDGWAGQ